MIRLEHVTAGYRGRAVAEDITLEFPRGEVSCILGKNGCGKSTLMKTAARLLRPLAGRVLLDGRDAASYSPREFARRVAVLPQSRSPAPIPVETLVAHGRFPHLRFPRILTPRDREIVDRAITAAGAGDLRGKYLDELSGGERQKVYLAMVLAQDTPVVLMDEPSTYLDIRHQFEMLALIRLLRAQGKAVAVILHDLSQALAAADRIYLLDGGRIVAGGDAREVFRSGAVCSVFGVRAQEVAAADGKTHYLFYE